MSLYKGRALGVSILILLSLFMVPLSITTNGVLSIIFNYMDEMLAVILIIYELFHRNHNMGVLQKPVLFYILFLLWGIICSALYSSQSIGTQLNDFVCCSKFIFAFIGTYGFIKRKPILFDKVKHNLEIFAKAVSIIVFCYTVVTFIQNRFSSPVSILGAHSANTSHIAVGLIVILIISTPAPKSCGMWVLLDLFVCISSFTGKSYGAAVLIAVLYYFKRIYNGFTKWLIWIAVVIGIALVGYDSFATFFLNSSSARSLLISNAVSLALGLKIFGYGYAMYGSAQAASNYSPLYEKLGFVSRYGMSREYNSYLTDSFWPTILGQFGFFGFILFGLFIFFIVKCALGLRKADYASFSCSIIILGYLLIMSSASSAFFNPIAVPFAIVLGMAMIRCNYDEKMEVNTLEY